MTRDYKLRAEGSVKKSVIKVKGKENPSVILQWYSRLILLQDL